MNWEKLLVLARGLAKQPHEVSQRTAVNRAYYAVFNLGRRWLEERVTPIDSRRPHGQVWETFRTAHRADERTRRKWETVGRLGGDLRLLRNQVDYEDRVDLSDEAARRAVQTAERILKLLTELEVDGPGRRT